MTDKIEVPRELLEELRGVVAFSYGESSRRHQLVLRELINKCDALLREATKEAVTPEVRDRPLSPEILVSALQDPVHKETGRTRPAKSYRHTHAAHTDNEGEELRRDAERYRWLRDHYGVGAPSWAWSMRFPNSVIVEGSLSDHIDAAIAAEKWDGER